MHTYTFCTLGISPQAFDEVKAILIKAGHPQAIIESDGKPTIDMRGLALVVDELQRTPEGVLKARQATATILFNENRRETKVDPPHLNLPPGLVGQPSHDRDRITAAFDKAWKRLADKRPQEWGKNGARQMFEAGRTFEATRLNHRYSALPIVLYWKSSDGREHELEAWRLSGPRATDEMIAFGGEGEQRISAWADDLNSRIDAGEDVVPSLAPDFGWHRFPSAQTPTA